MNNFNNGSLGNNTYIADISELLLAYATQYREYFSQKESL